MNNSFVINKIIGSFRNYLLFISLILSFVFVGIGIIFLAAGPDESKTTIPSVPTLPEAGDSNSEFPNDSKTLRVNSQLHVNGRFILAPSSLPEDAAPGTIMFDQSTSTLQYYNGESFVPISAQQDIVLPSSGVTSLQGQTGAITFNPGPGISINGTTISSSGILGINGVPGDINVATANGIASLTLPQSIAPSATPRFSALVLDSALSVDSGGTGAKNFSQDGVLIGSGTGAFRSVTASSPGQCLISTSGAPVFGVCGGGGLVAVALAPASPQEDTSSNSSIAVNKTLGTGNLLTLQRNGVNRFVVGNNGLVTAQTLNLTNALTVENGGTGTTGLSFGGVLIGQGAAPVTTVTTVTAGLCLMSTGGSNVPAFQPCPGGEGTAVDSLNGLTGALSIANASGSGSVITINDASTSQKGIASFSSTNFTASSGLVNTVQDINSAAAPTFSGLTLTAANPLMLGNSFLTNGGIVFRNSSNANTLTLQSGITASSFTLTLPTADGSSGQCLTTNGSGALSFSSCMSGGSGVASVNAMSGAITVTGTTNQVQISNGGGVVTISLPQNIHVSASPAFAGMTLSNALGVSSGGTGSVSLTANGVIIGNGTSALSSVVAGSAGLCLMSGAGVPSFQSCPGQGATAVDSLNGLTGALSIANASGSGSVITINDASTLAKGIARFNAANFNVSGGLVNTIQNINTSASPEFAGITLGSADTTTGIVYFYNNNNGFRTAITGNNNLSANQTLTLPDASGEICISSGNCSGAGGISGTIGYLARFTGANTLGDSVIFEEDAAVTIDGTLRVTAANPLSLGSANTADGSVTLYNSVNSNTVTLQSGVTNASYTLTLPSADGSSGQCLSTNGSGVLSFVDCLVGGGGGSGVTSLNGLTGALSIANASGSGSVITINDASTSQKGIASFSSTNFTASSGLVNTVQDIHEAAAPTFASLQTSTSSFNLVNATATTVNFAGEATAITIGSTSGTTLIRNTLVVSSEDSLVLGSESAANGSITFYNASNSGSVTLTSGDTDGALSLVLPTSYGAADQCLKTDGAGVLSFGVCLSGAGPGGGVTSLNNQYGSVNILNASGSGGNIIIDDASTSAKGIAQFNSTNFSVVSGVVNTIQGISTTSAPSFAGLQLSGALGVGTDTPESMLHVVGDGLLTGNITVQGSGAFTGVVSGADAVNNNEFVTLSQLSSAVGGVANGDILQGGNNLGGTTAMTLGTTNDGGFNFITNNTTRMSISSSGVLSYSGSSAIFQADANTTTAFSVNNSTGVSLLSVDTQNTTVNVRGSSNQAFRIQSGGSASVLNVDTNSGIVTFGQSSTLQGQISFTSSASNNTAVLRVANNLGANVIYELPDATAGTYEICTNAGNCSGAGDITGDGTANRLAMFDANKNIVDSAFLQSADTVAVDNGYNFIVEGGDLTINGNLLASSGTFTGTIVEAGNWMSQAAPSSLWNDVTYAEDLGLFVAVGSNAVMYSSNGATWAPGNISGVSITWNDVTYAEDLGLFVAVGANNSMTSSDGINWTTHSSFARTWASVTYGNGLFVATGTGGSNDQIMTSPDGVNWTMRSSNTNNFQSVTYAEDIGLFVIVASTGSTSTRVRTSTNGTSWTNRTAPSNFWSSVTYGNGLFVAVATDGAVMTSPNGITWTLREAPESNSWRAVAYGNGLFVAVSSDGENQVMTSPDGVNWASNVAAEANSWRSVTYSENLGLFTAVANSGTNRVMTRVSRDVYTTALTVEGAAFVAGDIIVDGIGSFGGTVSGSDAVNSNEFVTLGQLNGAIGGAGGGDVLQGGNSFGETMSIGTNDQYGLGFKVDGSTVASFSDIGAATFQNLTDSTAAFRIQNALNETILAVDTVNNTLSVSGVLDVVGDIDVSNNMTVGSQLIVGTLENGVVLSASGPILYTGTSRPVNQVLLAPEYQGAVIMGDGTNNVGYMTSDFCSGSSKMNRNTAVCPGALEEHNYYSWTTSEASSQDYDILLYYKIPTDFDGFVNDNTINMHGWRSSANDSVELALFKDGVQCGSTTNVSTSNGSWTQTVMSGNETSCDIAANDIVIFRIRLTATNGNFARAGAVGFEYFRKF